MQREVERKFLIKNEDFKKEEGIVDQIDIVQGYLHRDPSKVVRVRRTYQNYHNQLTGKITIKSKKDTLAGVDEFEYEIPEDEAQKLLEICDEPLLEKTRYVINHKDAVWEVDVFHGHKDGLILAELENQDIANENFPKWIGAEVTHLPEYYNANM